MTYTRIVTILASTLVLVASADGVWAHSSGAFDINGCHDDRRLHDFHCHDGDFRGKHFKSRAEMIRMKETGEDTSIQPARAGRFNDLANSLGRNDSKSGDPAQATDAAPQLSSGQAGPGASKVAAPLPPSGRSLEDRLATLKRLYEKDLITKREYDEKRRELIESL